MIITCSLLLYFYADEELGRGKILNESFENALRKHPIPFSLALLGFGFFFFTWPLFVYHTSLVLFNETTNERLKNAWQIQSGNPFKQ